MNYTDFQNTVTIRAVQAPSPYTALPPDFSNQIPRFINYAEGRIYRDFVFLAQRIQNSSLNFAAGSRSLDFSSITPTILVLEGVAMITPATDTPQQGTRWQFDAASLDVIDIFWPQEAVTLAPNLAENIGRYWALRDDHTIVVSPTPDQDYPAELTGIVQPAPLSSTNATTYISNVYPEVMIAAAMIDVMAYLQAFGAETADPKAAMSYEAQYQGLKPGVETEEQRRRLAGQGWSAFLPTPLAQPPRA